MSQSLGKGWDQPLDICSFDFGVCGAEWFGLVEGGWMIVVVVMVMVADEASVDEVLVDEVLVDEVLVAAVDFALPSVHRCASWPDVDSSLFPLPAVLDLKPADRAVYSWSTLARPADAMVVGFTFLSSALAGMSFRSPLLPITLEWFRRVCLAAVHGGYEQEWRWLMMLSSLAVVMVVVEDVMGW
jgi:hypothetical protein